MFAGQSFNNRNMQNLFLYLFGIYWIICNSMDNNNSNDSNFNIFTLCNELQININEYESILYLKNDSNNYNYRHWINLYNNINIYYDDSLQKQSYMIYNNTQYILDFPIPIKFGKIFWINNDNNTKSERSMAIITVSVSSVILLMFLCVYYIRVNICYQANNPYTSSNIDAIVTKSQPLINDETNVTEILVSPLTVAVPLDVSQKDVKIFDITEEKTKNEDQHQTSNTQVSKKKSIQTVIPMQQIYNNNNNNNNNSNDSNINIDPATSELVSVSYSKPLQYNDSIPIKQSITTNIKSRGYSNDIEIFENLQLNDHTLLDKFN